MGNYVHDLTVIPHTVAKLAIGYSTVSGGPFKKAANSHSGLVIASVCENLLQKILWNSHSATIFFTLGNLCTVYVSLVSSGHNDDHLHTCRELLQDDDVDPNARGEKQLTALQLAM